MQKKQNNLELKLNIVKGLDGLRATMQTIWHSKNWRKETTNTFYLEKEKKKIYELRIFHFSP